MTGPPPRRPDGDRLQHLPWPTDYDRRHVILYSSLLSAARAGGDWRVAARTLLRLDVEADEAAARAIWQSHVDRAHWFWTGGPR